MLEGSASDHATERLLPRTDEDNHPLVIPTTAELEQFIPLFRELSLTEACNE